MCKFSFIFDCYDINRKNPMELFLKEKNPDCLQFIGPIAITEYVF